MDQTLRVDSWDHLSQMLSVTGTFVQATSILATFVHIRNICEGALSLAGLNFFGPEILWTNNFFDPKFFWSKFFLIKFFFGFCWCKLSKNFEPELFSSKNFLDQHFFGPIFVLVKKKLVPKKHFDPKIFLDVTYFLTQNFLDQHFFGPKIFLDRKFFWT